MLTLDIQGFGDLTLQHLVLDFNGTIATGGTLLPGIAHELNELSTVFEIHIVTGDSFGTARRSLSDVKCTLEILSTFQQAEEKARYISALNPERVIAMGNGRNDMKMLQLARVGVAVLGEDGLATDAALAANILVKDIFSALSLLKNPKKLVSALKA